MNINEMKLKHWMKKVKAAIIMSEKIKQRISKED